MPLRAGAGWQFSPSRNLFRQRFGWWLICLDVILFTKSEIRSIRARPAAPPAFSGTGRSIV